ncbi:universal stress protein [Streptomyces turgidiscabies]|uniref:Universal stress family protein n=1 Tax=Streptomyces turgidiscabies (strain Car8) TaxID=698760 RepID=L7FCQ7_STRT8|nr:MULTISPECIES: universal stress protein [Streptomyces]ELP68831.1 universal stress family protein [Streptomyces turgidiscabies Car8]MDX3495243.1 universal stress protein [Streptomyces turgidiscabies]GAQ71121.1 universal stress protein/MT2061 [Streptomyces turgidiscabies]
MTDLPLVVGVDGSEQSFGAVDWAADEATVRGVPLRLVYASQWERYEGDALAQDLGRSPERILAETIVEAADERAHRRQADVKVVAEVLPEEPVPALLREGRNASALVLGTRGRSGITELLLGSVSLAVAGRAQCPVIVVGCGPERRPRIRTEQRVVLGVGADPNPAAVDFAFRAAADRDATLRAVRAWRRPAHETVDHPLLTGEPARLHEQQAAEVLEEALRDTAAEHPSVRVRRQTVEGPARKVLVEASATADLLVVGAQRREGHFGIQLGPVTHAALHHSACPVAVVPQRA